MGNKSLILVVDDEQAIRKFVRLTLEAQSYAVIDAANGQEAIALSANHKPDLVILDLGLPDMDGLEVIRALRSWTQTPIVVLSVKDSDEDKIGALDAGADDYLTKPFSVGELLARLRVSLRRQTHAAVESQFASGELKVDLARRLVTVGEKEIHLTPNEYDLLRVLIVNPGKVLTHRQLLREVWGTGFEQDFHVLHVNVANLRRKIELNPARPRHVITEPGVGYRLKID